LAFALIYLQLEVIHDGSLPAHDSVGGEREANEVERQQNCQELTE
jgi:hypothetical protein